MTNQIDHPGHYGGDTEFETIKVLEAWLTPQEFAGFLKGNQIKYLSRHRDKGGLIDLQKANWYGRAFEDFIGRLTHAKVYPSGIAAQAMGKDAVDSVRDLFEAFDAINALEDKTEFGDAWMALLPKLDRAKILVG
jgi:hypothetical protein